MLPNAARSQGTGNVEPALPPLPGAGEPVLPYFPASSSLLETRGTVQCEEGSGVLRHAGKARAVLGPKSQQPACPFQRRSPLPSPPLPRGGCEHRLLSPRELSEQGLPAPPGPRSPDGIPRQGAEEPTTSERLPASRATPAVSSSSVRCPLWHTPPHGTRSCTRPGAEPCPEPLPAPKGSLSGAESGAYRGTLGTQPLVPRPEHGPLPGRPQIPPWHMPCWR